MNLARAVRGDCERVYSESSLSASCVPWQNQLQCSCFGVGASQFHWVDNVVILTKFSSLVAICVRQFDSISVLVFAIYSITIMIFYLIIFLFSFKNKPGILWDIMGSFKSNEIFNYKSAFCMSTQRSKCIDHDDFFSLFMTFCLCSIISHAHTNTHTHTSVPTKAYIHGKAACIHGRAHFREKRVLFSMLGANSRNEGKVIFFFRHKSVKFWKG